MAELMDIKLTGANELKAVIEKLPQVLADKVYMQALRTGANFMRDEVKARVPVADSYNQSHAFTKKGRSSSRTLLIKLRDEIRVKVLTKTDISYELAVHTGRAFWGLFFEFGTAERSTASGAGRGRITPHPFMRPAFEANKTKALDMIGKELGLNVEKQAARLAGPLSKSGLLRK